MVRLMVATLIFFAAFALASSLCSIYGDDEGSEDVSLWRNGVALLGSGLFAKNSGGIIAVTLDTHAPQVSKVPLQGVPNGFGFRPHGIYIDNATQRLFVISHSEMLQEESIVVFNIVAGEVGLPPARLEFLFALVSANWTWHGTSQIWFLNDLVTTGPNEILTTQYGPSAAEKSNIPAVPHYLWRCTWDIADVRADGRLPAVCSHAHPKSSLTGLNGMTIDATKTRVWANDLWERELWEYTRNTSDGSLTFVNAAPYSGWVDNIEYDLASGDITMGGISPKGILVSAKNQVAGTWGSAVVALKVLNHQDYQVSAGILYGPWYVMGSPYAQGVLICSASMNPDRDTSMALTKHAFVASFLLAARIVM